MPLPKTFLDVPSDDLLRFLEQHQAPPFRLAQIYEWFFSKEAADFEAMTNLPASLRQALKGQYRLHPLALRRKEESAQDGTIRFHFQGHDGRDISTVYLPEGDRLSLCLSTQVGCAYRCAFCASGLVPFERQLSAAEIIDQILLIQKDQKRRVTNLLFMGMGEPLANATQVVQAIRWITSAQG